MKKTSLFALALGIALYSCSGSKTEDHSMHEGHEMGADAKSEHSEMAMSNASTPVIDAYLSIKDAFVNDNSSEAASKAPQLIEAIKGFDINAYEGEDFVKLEELQMEAAMVAENLTSEDIAAQRESFQALSVLMTDFIKIAGTDRTLYQQYCPMYKNNTGGIWLSASEDIKNPLFGSSMLTCGRVEETLALN
ncbi:DUF3347 domain-containing protein [Algoriphagus zhangzhouensis]|uniref:DUF3347 domain-containing protein n=1 Tax=Algoriphagus zhangzhouensis TaxID=1073327 RepID=A0A1M7Z3W1_9BACT|nr:DUF3347 domain-containing protein [Algoriphagus zhangzhouensis]TDY48513.1 uncharacterized protein DUF3347 [Algoriphagus zhangzhouensis]SHO59561.1 Protein of unknown function [Algoriphagus zhangzhouensis]